MASTSLSQTAGTPTNQNTGTLSFWMKLGNIGVNNEKLYHTQGGSDSNTFTLQFQGTTDRLMIANNGGVLLILNRVLRDTSAWYHIVCVSDPSNATANQRLRIYINGVEETSMATDNRSSVGTSSVGISVNSQIRYISGNGSQDYFDGYMADYYFIDGQALSPTDFGQTDSTGIWKPKGYSGSYGNNGFYLKFSNSGDLGADSSGNGNNFTKSGNGRQRTDTPSNVFATLNSTTYDSSGMTFSEGNTKVIGRAGASSTAVSTQSFSSGKWYAEFKIGNTHKTRLGAKGTNWYDNNNTQIGTVYDHSGYVYIGSQESGSLDTTIPAYTTGDIIGVFVDKDNNTIKFSKNGTVHGISQTLSQDEYAFYVFDYSGTGDEQLSVQANFGNPSFSISSGNSDVNGYGNFEYSPNDGTYDYLALCTKNLATELSPTIDDGSTYFQTKTYSGNGVETAITNDGNSDLQPDLIWFKARSATYYHGLFDSTRGTELRLSSNVTDAEVSKPSAFTSFDSNGFTVGADVSNTTNANGQTFVAWQWKANAGSTSSNTDGSITSTVQANPTAGFSIVTYTGTGSSSTAGHGLNSTPEIIISKARNATQDWAVHTTIIDGSMDFLVLNNTNAKSDSSFSLPTSTVFPTRTSNDYVAYIFHSVEGYSKFGSYTGNGSADGPFVYTGFRPAWIMIKGTSSLGGDQAYVTWSIWDINRSTYNVTSLSQQLTANTNNAEGIRGNGSSGSGIDSFDILSNGFKIRNGSYEYNQGNYIYMAFAENPFVTSGGLPVTAR